MRSMDSVSVSFFLAGGTLGPTDSHTYTLHMTEYNMVSRFSYLMRLSFYF